MFADIHPRQSVLVCGIRGFAEAMDSLCIIRALVTASTSVRVYSELEASSEPSLAIVDVSSALATA